MDIQLQDIIQIHWNEVDKASPKYIVDFISSEHFRVINIDNLEIKTMVVKDGVPDTGDDTIVQIDILNRSDLKGYAEQNNLEPGVWINIGLDGAPPIKGKIFYKEEDMIVVKLVLDAESLLNLPKWDIPEIRNAKDSLDNWATSPDEKDDIKFISEWDSPEEEETDKVYIDFKYEGLPDNVQIEIIENPLLIYIDATEIILPAKAGPIEFDINFNPSDEIIELYEEVDVSEEEKRYDLSVQLDDLLDDLLTDIPTYLRTREKLNELNIIVDRFKELRYIFSNIDANGYIKSLRVHEPDYNPVASVLEKLDKSLFWLMPVVKNKRKIYDVDEDNFASDVLPTRLKSYLELENSYQDMYESHFTQNRYITLLNNQQTLNKEYLLPDELDDQMILTVNTNLPVVINNAIMGEDSKSTTFGKKKKSSKASLNSMTNATAVYSLPTTYVTNNAINIKFPRDRQFISNKDSLVLKDFIKLNKFAIAYSSLYLPATNIYVKSILNANPRYMYRFLNNHITPKYIDLENAALDNVSEDVSDDDLSTINQNIQYKQLSTPNLEGFIKKVVPTINDKIAYIKDMNPAPLSIYSAILRLESFLVYTNTIDHEMVLKLQEILNANMENLKLSYKTHLSHLDRTYRYEDSNDIMLLDKSSFKDIIDKVEDIPDYKFLKDMLGVDGCTLYTLLLVQQNFELNIQKDVDTFLEDEPVTREVEPEEGSFDCKQYVMAKQYTSREDLKEDNNKLIYYDKHLDPTRYDTMDIYKTPLESISSEKDKKTYLINILQQTVGMNENQATEEAIALLELKRIAPEGVYASLMVNHIYTYYKRIDNTWLEDTNIPKIPLESNTIFCNIQPKCMVLKSKCETINEIKIPSYMDNLKAFDRAVEKEVELFKQNITENITYHIGYYNKVIILEGIKKLKYNNMYYRLGLESGANIPTQSPYLELMTAIIGQSDFVKRQHDIMKFVNIYTRAALDEENQFFRYCVKTNESLIPTFLVELASTWINFPGKYIQTLNKICFKQGKLSDDGDSWVDGHSGYVIKMIESVSEFQSSGPDLILSNELFIAPKKNIELTTTLDTIVNAIANKLGINIEKQIVDIKTIYNNLIENRSFLKSSEQFKKVKKLADYEKYKNILLVRAAIATFISVIQTSIPNYKSITTNPGCVKDFSGYPLSNNKDNTRFIKYIVCIVKSLIHSQAPWKYIRSQQENLETKIIKDITKIAANENYQLLKKKKIAYLELNPIDDNSVIIDNNWVYFLPPLTIIDQASITPCTTEVLDTLPYDMDMGNKEQYNTINILKGKIQLFSIRILKLISTAISTKAVVMSNSFNEPFIENSCCLELQHTSILTYLFGPTLTKITNEINHINSYDTMLNDIYYLSKPPVLLCLENTIFELSNTISDYSESIIILAIIKYCNYDNYKLVPDTLLSLCGDKPENYNSFDSFADKVDIIKDHKGQLTTELLFSMLKVVYTEVKEDLAVKILYGHSNILVNYVKNFADIHSIPHVDEVIKIYLQSNEEILEEYSKAKKENNIPVQMIIEDAAIKYYKEQLDDLDSQVLITNRYIYNILETINDATYSPETLELMDQMDNFNQLSLTIIKDIIEEQDMPTRLKQLFIKKRASKEEAFIDGLFDWKDNNVSNNMSWVQYVIYNLTTILPNIIINDYKYENIKIPKYWKLHLNHEMKIKNMISSEVSGSEFNPFIPFMHKSYIKDWFISIKPSLDYYLEISKGVIIKESEMGMFDETTSKKLLEYCVFEVCKLYMGGDEHMKGFRDRALFIATAMNMFLRTKHNINWSFNEIVYDVNKSKETEKEAVINRLESMSDEEKQLDKEMKNLKLGPWAIEHVTNYNANEWAKTDNDIENDALRADMDEHDNIEEYKGENDDES